MLEKSKEKYGEKPAFKFKTKTPNEFKTITYNKFIEDINCLGTKLIELGLENKRIAIISDNRYEWCVAYLAVSTGTGIVVPLDKLLPANEIESLLIRSEAEAIFYSEKYNDIMAEIRKNGKTNLKEYISMDLKGNSKGILSQKELIRRGKKLLKKGNREFIDKKINNEEMSFMLFTSGTTAMSKAVMLSQKNICSNLMDIAAVIKLTPEDTLLSFLPLHHTFECTVGFLYPMYAGANIAFCDGLRHIADNIKEYKITAMISVPILFENMYKKILKQIEKQGKLELVKKAMKVSSAVLKFNIDIREMLFKDIHENLGGKLRLLVSGGAALDKETAEGFNSLGFNLYQGYGLTETSPVIAAEDDKYRKIGSIGKAFPSLEVKIIEQNEKGIGELIVKGPTVMLGYYNNEEATKNVIDEDGWFHTGDLGYIDNNGYIFICGRMKNVIVLKNGKNVYPEELENYINKIEGIKESIVYGKPLANDEIDLKLCAKIVYDETKISEKFNLNEKDKIKEFIWEQIKEINKTMPTYKYIKEIDVTNNELIKTTTQKVKRHEEIAKILGK